LRQTLPVVAMATLAAYFGGGIHRGFFGGGHCCRFLLPPLLVGISCTGGGVHCSRHSVVATISTNGC